MCQSLQRKPGRLQHVRLQPVAREEQVAGATLQARARLGISSVLEDSQDHELQLLLPAGVAERCKVGPQTCVHLALTWPSLEASSTIQLYKCQQPPDRVTPKYLGKSAIIC